MQIVEIVWFDAQSSLSSMELESAKEFFKPQLTKSVGYLVHEDDDMILLSFMKFGKETFKHWQMIPKGMEKSRKIIKTI
jgi:hypothetical protein